MAGDEQLRAGVSQQVSAHDHSQVAVAGGNIYIGVPAGQELAWLPLAAGRLPGSQRVDPTALLDSLGVDRFAGRKWLAAGVDKFIEVQEGPAGLGRGYVVVEAAAGMGKTAFAAHLARTRGYPAHFTRLPQGRSSSVALRNLAAQIAEQVNADERWNAGPVETPVAFATFLQDAAARHPGRLVFVVDGLDEADDDGAELPLGLPADLPAGVFAIVTCRSSTELSGLREPFSVLPIEARASENLDDLHTYLAQQIAAEPLAAILAGSGLSSAEFIGDLLNSCGGLWVYLKYVLDEIRTGRRSPHDVTGLPRSLGQFYADSLRPLRRDRTAWVSLHRPVLSTLAAAAEPVTVAALAALSGVDDVDAVHGFCDYLYRPFLAADEVTGRWSLYHATLQEFLTGTGPGDGASAGQARDALRRELARATQAAHHHIADRYLALFGTLDHGLARLVTDPAVADCDEAYGLRNLAEHLIAAGRFDEMHRVLTAQTLRADSALPRNSWYTAHNRLGSVDLFLRDIRRAREHVRLMSDAELARGRRPAMLDTEARYELMAANAVAAAGQVPIELIEQLVDSGAWTVDRAVRHALGLAWPEQSADLVTRLATRQAIPEEALARVLRGLHRTPHMSPRHTCLSKLAPLLPAELLDHALRVAGESREAFELAALAPSLPASLLPAAARMALTCPSDEEKAIALEALVPRLESTELDQVTVAALAMDDLVARARLLTAVAPLLAGDRRTEAFQAAITTAAAMITHEPYSSALNPDEVLAAVAADLPSGLVALAHEVAWTIPRSRGRQIALAGLARRLHGDERQAAMAEAVGGDDRMVAKAAGMLASLLTDDLVDRAFMTLSQHVRYLDGNPLVDRLTSAHYARALDVVEHMPGDEGGAWYLSWIAPHLPADLRARARAIAIGLTPAESRFQALIAVAATLPPQQRHTDMIAALKLAITKHVRANTHELAPYLPEDIASAARSYARLIADPDKRARTLADLAARAPWSASVRQETAVEALRVADSTPRLRWQTLVTVAPVLPPDELGRAVDQSMTYGARERALVLAALAPRLTGPLLDRAFDACHAIDPADISNATDRLLPPPSVSHQATQPLTRTTARASAEALLSNDDYPTRAAKWPPLVPLLSPEFTGKLVEQILPRFVQVTDDWSRDLAALAPAMSAATRSDVLTAVFSPRIPIHLRVRVLSALIPQLADAERQPLMREVLQAAPRLDFRWGELRTELVTVLALSTLPDAMRALDSVRDKGVRADLRIRLVNHLAPALPEPELQALADSSLAQVRLRDISSHTLCAFYTAIPPAAKERLMAVIGAEPDDRRGKLYLAVYPALPQPQRMALTDTVLHTISALESFEVKRIALARIMPGLPLPAQRKMIHFLAELDGLDTARAIGAIIDDLDPKLHDALLDRIETIDRLEYRFQSLAELAPHAEPSLHPRILRTIRAGWDTHPEDFTRTLWRAGQVLRVVADDEFPAKCTAALKQTADWWQ